MAVASGRPYIRISCHDKVLRHCTYQDRPGTSTEKHLPSCELSACVQGSSNGGAMPVARTDGARRLSPWLAQIRSGMADTVGGLYCQWGHTQHYGYLWPTPLGRVSGDRMTHLHVPGAQLEISHEHVVSGVAREGRGVGCGCLWWDDWSRELRGVFCGDLSGDAPERLPWLLRRQWVRLARPSRVRPRTLAQATADVRAKVCRGSAVAESSTHHLDSFWRLSRRPWPCTHRRQMWMQ